MKTDISRISHRAEQRYSGVYQQQGRMLTDADWNELVDILKAKLRDALRCVVGSGTPALGGLRVETHNNNLQIQPGWLFAEGVQARLGGEAPLTLGTSSNNDQPDFPGSPPLQTGITLPGNPGQPVGITLYADVWERSITALDDSGLLDPALNGADTCTRSRTMLQVKWMPTPRWQDRSRWLPPLGNGLLKAKARQPTGSEASVDEEDNYLFRVEVHDVVRDAADGRVNGFTLKWSRENAAQQYSLNLPDSDGTRRLGVDFLPDDFLPQEGDSKHWAYELFNEASECHIGMHLAAGFEPTRGHLIRGPGQVSQEFSNTQSKCYDRISRWDGWVKVLGSASSPTSPIQVEGIDRGQPLQLSAQADKHGDVRVDHCGAEATGLELELLLERLQLKLILGISNPVAMMAGDHWLLPVRSGRPPENAAPPQGIRHHYTKLAELDTSGRLIEPHAGSEEAQHLGFRSLTQLSGSGHTHSALHAKEGAAPSVQVVGNRAVSIGRYPLDGNGAAVEPPTDKEVLRITGDEPTQGAGAVEGMGTEQPIVSVDKRGWMGIGTKSPGAPCHIVAQSSLKENESTYGNPDMWGKHIIDGAQQMWGERNLYGRLFTWASDSLFVGLQSRDPAEQNKQDAIIAWGDDPDDSLRFVHVPHWSPGNPQPNPSIECMRLTADGAVGLSKTTPAAETRLHIGGKNLAPNAATCEPALPDVVVTKKGFVGIGTASPETPLHIFIDTPAEPSKPANLWGRQIRDGNATSGLGTLKDCFGRSVHWDTDHIFMGLKNVGSNRKDAVISWGDDEDDELRFIYSGHPKEMDCMRIKSDGCVVVGKKSMLMSGAKLAVGGELAADEVKATSSISVGCISAKIDGTSGSVGVVTATIFCTAPRWLAASNIQSSNFASGPAAKLVEVLLVNSSASGIKLRLIIPPAKIDFGSYSGGALTAQFCLHFYSASESIGEIILDSREIKRENPTLEGKPEGILNIKPPLGFITMSIEFRLMGGSGAKANVESGEIEVIPP